MVFYFSIPEGLKVYMGKDKYENEDLIKWAWKEDIWFHVEGLSSAHVYVRLPEEHPNLIDQIPEYVIQQLCQLTKKNSIEGCKKEEVSIVYTPASNLRKEHGMEVGAVLFHDKKLVRHIHGVKKDKDVLKPVMKSKTESFPNLEQEKEAHEQEKRAVMKKKFNDDKKTKQELEKQKLAEKRAWDDARRELDERDNDSNTGGRKPIDEDDFI